MPKPFFKASYVNFKKKKKKKFKQLLVKSNKTAIYKLSKKKKMIGTIFLKFSMIMIWILEYFLDIIARKFNNSFYNFMYQPEKESS